MKEAFESAKLFIADFSSYILGLVRVSAVTPLDGDKATDAESSPHDRWAGLSSESAEAVTGHGSLRHRTKHPGYVTSNGLGSLEVGGVDD